MLPHRRGPVDKRSASLIVRFVVKLGLSARALLDNDLAKAFFEQEGDILGSDSHASFIGKGFTGNSDGELTVWHSLGEDGSRVLGASSWRCGWWCWNIGQDRGMADKLERPLLAQSESQGWRGRLPVAGMRIVLTSNSNGGGNR